MHRRAIGGSEGDRREGGGGGGEDEAALWYNGSYAFFESFGIGNLGHTIFDDLFGAFMTMRLFGGDPRTQPFGVVLNAPCSNPVCIRAYYDWARGISSETLVNHLNSTLSHLNPTLPSPGISSETLMNS